MLQFGKYKMDANERINQLIEINEQLNAELVMLKSCNKGLASGRDKIVKAAKELGYEFSLMQNEMGYLIETARASVMVNQKNVELQSQLVAIQDSVVHGKCANSEPCATFCEAIATRKMFKQLQVERDAYRKLADSMAALMVKHKRVFASKELNGAENHLAAHDAEVVIKAIEEYRTIMMRELFDLIPVRSTTSFKNDYINRIRIRDGDKR